jgi:hypothetical protein
MIDRGHDGGGGRKGLPTKWVLVGFLAIAAYFLLAEHRAHFIQLLPFLLLLACPLLHGLHGHGGRGGGDRDKSRRTGDETGEHRHEGEPP